MSRKSTRVTPLDQVRWFWFGLKEHRTDNDSRAHDWRLLDAYWAGHRFGYKLPWVIRRHFPRVVTR